MQGKIIKGIGGFYYVHIFAKGLYECKAKGIFRKQGIKPLVGDDVECEILDEEKQTGNICDILPRKNELLRPHVANVDQAVVIFAAMAPKPNCNLLDRFLFHMHDEGVHTIICFNKADLVTREELLALEQIYESVGYPVLQISTKTEKGIEPLLSLLHGKTTVLAGPSGVGKSSLTNLLQPAAQMEIGEISRKLARGKHTTRHSELFCIEENTYVMDTPGFSSLEIPKCEPEELKGYFPEFDKFEKFCRFQGCLHVGEPECGIKEAVAEGKISRVRYGNYTSLLAEVREQANRRYK